MTDTQEKPMSDALIDFAAANYELGYADARKKYDASFAPVIYETRTKELIEKRKSTDYALARKGAAAEGLVTAAQEAMHLLDGYGAHHKAKGALEKAGRNYAMASVLANALAAWRKEGA